jgi:hypothetical protein
VANACFVSPIVLVSMLLQCFYKNNRNTLRTANADFIIPLALNSKQPGFSNILEKLLMMIFKDIEPTFQKLSKKI